MQTKLTLRLEKELIQRAKVYAAQHGKSVSQVVADYFTLLDDQRLTAPELTPTVAALKGALGGTGVDEQDYRRHWEEKYR